MKSISIDIETYSNVDLSKCGVYKYVESEDFEVLLFAYAIDGGEVQVVDLTKGEEIPSQVIEGLHDNQVEKYAFNANFERVCLSKYFGRYLCPKGWRCTMVWCATLGLPLSLEGVGEVLNLKNQKLKEGKDLIKYFCTGSKDKKSRNLSTYCTESSNKRSGNSSINCTKSNNKRNRNLPIHNKKKWEKFKEYNKRDVECEMEIQQKLKKFPVSEREWENYELDQIINDKGIMIDGDFVRSAIVCDEKYKKYMIEKGRELTNLENPNSIAQLKMYLEKEGVQVTSLSEGGVDKLLKEIEEEVNESNKVELNDEDVLINKKVLNNNDIITKKEISNDNDTVISKEVSNDKDIATSKEVSNKESKKESIKEVLLIRKELSKSSVKKYHTMDKVMCKDSRARGLIQFYGATKTGRYAGRLIQVQNLPQNHLKDLELARELVKNNESEAISFLYDSMGSVLSQLVRTAFIPKKGCKFIVADFSSIEARVLAWICNERWRIKAFENNEDLYSASASRMFLLPVKKDGEYSHLRQCGKVAELALGYGGSVGALKAMGALNAGLKEDKLSKLVKTWRNSNTNITKMWWDMDKAMKQVVSTSEPVMLYNMKIFYEDNMLFILLPSRRKLCYRNPEIVPNKFGGMSITYDGMNSAKKWTRIESYGPKFVENIVQAISRDLLCFAMKNLSHREYDIVMHVHDEVVIESEDGSVEEVCEIMSKVPSWAEGLKLSADGYECDFYRKG